MPLSMRRYSSSIASSPAMTFIACSSLRFDTASTEQVFSILRDIADNGQTVVVVTHDAALAARADRRIHIVDGKIHETSFGIDRKPEVAAATGASRLATHDG